MNTEQLKKIIKECVREGVREELEEIFGNSSKPIVSNKPPTEKSKFRAMLEEEDAPKTQTTPQVQKEFKKYTKNEMLNQILNETKALPAEGAMVSGISEMGSEAPGGKFVTKADSMLKEVSSVNPQAANVLTNVFNKNYSALLKASKEKSKNK